jgi:hypothetical protein
MYYLDNNLCNSNNNNNNNSFQLNPYLFRANLQPKGQLQCEQE